jgi:hypothetical protein
VDDRRAGPRRRAPLARDRRAQHRPGAARRRTAARGRHAYPPRVAPRAPTGREHAGSDPRNGSGGAGR